MTYQPLNCLLIPIVIIACGCHQVQLYLKENEANQIARNIDQFPSIIKEMINSCDYTIPCTLCWVP